MNSGVVADGTYYLAGIIIVGVIAVVIARDANRRGMNGIVWGLGVFLLCIVFLPIYLIVRKPVLTAPGAANVPPSRTQFCGNCGAEMPAGARFCQKCGFEVKGS